MKKIIAYIPVVHKGYVRFLEKHSPAEVYLLGENLLAEFPHLEKDIRSLPPADVKKMLTALGYNVTVLQKISGMKNAEIIMPDEDIMHELAEKYFAGQKIFFDTVFLRWDKQNAMRLADVHPDAVLSVDKTHQKFMQIARDIGEKSADWWRQVGVAITKNGKLLFAGKNSHGPHEQQHYFNGDPRGNFHKGKHIEISTSQHAEAGLIARAAKEGVSLNGAEMYVTTFPCPVCAKLVAASGIKNLYYAEGYSLVDGEQILKSHGISITRVEFSQS